MKNLGVDGPQPADGPNSAGPDSGQVTVPGSHTTGTWLDETDIRPTLMYLTGLRDDYEHDGRVITQILTDPNQALSGPGVARLGACYKQLNSSVGEFGTDTLIASTAALESNAPGDSTYTTSSTPCACWTWPGTGSPAIKGELEAAAFSNDKIHGIGGRSWRATRCSAPRTCWPATASGSNREDAAAAPASGRVTAAASRLRREGVRFRGTGHRAVNRRAGRA